MILRNKQHLNRFSSASIKSSCERKEMLFSVVQFTRAEVKKSEIMEMLHLKPLENDTCNRCSIIRLSYWNIVFKNYKIHIMRRCWVKSHLVSLKLSNVCRVPWDMNDVNLKGRAGHVVTGKDCSGWLYLWRSVSV